ncbi:MAG: carboxypeptidase-like regulatory domain-containing protein [Ignavibacteria bacterium]
MKIWFLGNILINISGNGETYKTYSSSSGKYEIDLPPGKYTISIKNPGYNAYEYKNFSIPENRNKDMILFLYRK